MRSDQHVELIVYGDFNCPFSALASARVSRLERLGRAKVDWRAVEHAPDIPLAGNEMTGARRAELRRELDLIRGLLTAQESDQLALPTVQPNTNLATAAYAGTPAAERPSMRARLFATCWSDGAALADSTTLARLSASHADGSTATRWHDEWLALTDPIVPMMVLPDGYVSRGLGALARLAELIDNTTDAGGPGASGTTAAYMRVTDPADLGGEPPCFAHLLDDPHD